MEAKEKKEYRKFPQSPNYVLIRYAGTENIVNSVSRLQTASLSVGWLGLFFESSSHLHLVV